jgi:hypothetical protein
VENLPWISLGLEVNASLERIDEKMMTRFRVMEEFWLLVEYLNG